MITYIEKMEYAVLVYRAEEDKWIRYRRRN
jgi:hypothetical protein